MKFRNTVQLGALLLVLIIAYLGWQKLEQHTETTIQEAKRIFSFTADDIRKLTVHQLEAEATTAVQDENGQWSITAPNPSIPPNEVLWERVAAQTADLLNERSLPDEALALDSYGLELPRLTVKVEAKGQEHALRFGYLEPTQTYRYARLDDGAVFLVNKDAVFELDRPLELLRQAYIVGDHEAPVLRFEFARILDEQARASMENPPPLGTESDAVIILERPDAETPWQQMLPVHAAANQERVNEIVTEMQFARGKHFVDAPEALADYGLDPASVRITIDNSEEDGGEQTFYFGDQGTAGNTSGVWARKEGEPAVFLLDGHLSTLFPRSTNAFRERKLLTRQAKNIQQIQFIGKDQSFTLTRDLEGLWTMTDPPLDDTDNLYVSQYVTALKSLEAVQFYPGTPAQYGLDDPDVRLVFQMEGGEMAEIRLTPDPQVPENYYVLTDAGELAGIPAERVGFLKASPGQFRELALLQFPVNRAMAMQFEFDGVEYVLENAHNRWRVVQPENSTMLNQQDAQALLQAVSNLRAVTADPEAAEDPAELGFDAPRFAFSVTLAAPAADSVPETVGPLVVGAVVPGIADQRFARSGLRTGVFRVKQSFIEQVSAAVTGIRQVGATGN